MKVAVVVPRRSDGGRRDELWRWVKARMEAEHPTFDIIEGHHDGGPFNRSAAINDAVRKAGVVDVLVISDADSFVSHDQLWQAVQVASLSGKITFAYDRFYYLSREMSDRVMDGFDGAWEPGVEFSMSNTCSSMVVIPYPLWQMVGPADEGFVGWGGEDIAISLTMQTFGNGMHRITGPVWHLWHPTAPHTHDHLWPDRIERYSQAAYDIDKMSSLLAELRS